MSGFNSIPPCEIASDSKSWLHTLATCDSTNTWALEHLTQLKHGDVVFTRNQTAGRGQFDRVWHSQCGTLTASFILDFSIAQLPGFSLIAGLAVIQAIETLLPVKLQLKWTNDVFAEERKLAGILCESRIQGDQVRMVVGIGINRAGVPDSLTRAISLSQISASVLDEQVLLTQLRDRLLQLCQQSLVDLLPEIRSRDFLYQKKITLEVANELLTGEGAGMDAEGQLLIQSSEGIRAFRSGRVVKIYELKGENYR
ncbi:MAG: biotin--[acetyl-CoA-carboxylase] ligase [Leptolyngbya sp. Prado105]|nr:biotin--[acetyl-CoA-carboxylase] ligase [Leptolyngbya sp. Prado105]